VGCKKVRRPEGREETGKSGAIKCEWASGLEKKRKAMGDLNKRGIKILREK